MDIGGNTVLLTGGGTGIGFALAEKFVDAGSEVMVCGRRMKKLRDAGKKLPSLHIRRCDVSVESERIALQHWTKAKFPNLNVLVNNAGIQREMDFTSPTIAKERQAKDDEVTINFGSMIRLCGLYAPQFLKKKEAAIMNISSGLAFVPIASMPGYCATKAATHSFTVSLRHQLRGTSVRVFEAVPPTTDTELDAGFAGPEEQSYRGISPQEVATAIVKGMREDKEEIFIGQAQGLYEASKQNFKEIFSKLND